MAYNDGRTVYLFCCQFLDQTPINQRAFLVSKPELAISCSSPSVKKVCESSLVFTLQFSHWWKFWHTRLFIITWKPQWKPYNSLQSENRPHCMWITTFFSFNTNKIRIYWINSRAPLFSKDFWKFQLLQKWFWFLSLIFAPYWLSNS